MTAVSAVGGPVSGQRARSVAPKVLIVSPVAPVAEGVGGVYLRDLCLLYPASRLAFAILPGIGRGAWPASLEAAPRLTLAPVPERGFDRWGRRVQRSTRPLFDWYVHRRHLAPMIESIAAFAAEVRPDLLWMPLSGPTMVNLAGPLARRLGVPLVTTVWDAPEYFLRDYWQLDGSALERHLRRFDAAMRSSTRCGVASPEMKAAYEARYATPCVPMVHGLPASQWLPPSGIRPPDGPFVIGYAGSLYARQEWSALMAALDSAGWRVGDRDVIVRVLAAGLDVQVAAPCRIEFLGWRSSREAASILSGCDICYVPYWFDPAHRHAVELSFPNKIALYLAAGRPILFHGPERSTPTRFLTRHRAGLACHSLAPRDILGALTVAATDEAFHHSAARAIPNALREELGMHVFRRRFAELLGVDDDVLAPAPG